MSYDLQVRVNVVKGILEHREYTVSGGVGEDPKSQCLYNEER